MSKTRVEKDSMGELEVPEDALYAAQTQRAVLNFPISGLPMPRSFIKALGLVKCAAALSNHELELMDANISKSIQEAALEVSQGKHDAHFPIDVFQTGSGTSSNMNANEVIANLASRQSKLTVHANDHVNMSQSSNDVIPTAIHVSVSLDVEEKLIPSLNHLQIMIEHRADELVAITKTGRTHLMDAMPVTLGQELSGWAQQIKQNIQRLKSCQEGIQSLTIGGTAVGTGINAPSSFGETMCRHLSQMTSLSFKPRPNYFEGLSCQDSIVELSGHLRTTAVSLMKIANDLRWMNSGPLAGLGEIVLPAVQPGSSIMPGKVNPVIAESVCMICAQVMGNDQTIAISGQAGNFQLNVMLPVIAYNALQSIHILANGAIMLADTAIQGFQVNEENLKLALDKNPILVTALNRVIGYEQGAKIAKTAYAQKRPIKEVALEMTDLSEAELDALLDPADLAKGGIKG